YKDSFVFFFFSSRRRHTRWPRDWSSDVCSSDLGNAGTPTRTRGVARERGNAKRRAVADPTARLLVFSQLFACPDHGSVLPEIERSEERRVGKECRTGWAAEC